MSDSLSSGAISKRFSVPCHKRVATIKQATFTLLPGLIQNIRIEEGDQTRCKGGKPPMLSHETAADPYKRTRLDYHATVRELPSHERPRERLQHFGPQALSMAELLAIV